MCSIYGIPSDPSNEFKTMLQSTLGLYTWIGSVAPSQALPNMKVQYRRSLARASNAVMGPRYRLQVSDAGVGGSKRMEVADAAIGVRYRRASVNICMASTGETAEAGPARRPGRCNDG